MTLPGPSHSSHLRHGYRHSLCPDHQGVGLGLVALDAGLFDGRIEGAQAQVQEGFRK